MALDEVNGFGDLYDPGQAETEKLQVRLKLERLIYPGGMGSIFKVLIQHRSVAAPQLTVLRYARAPWRPARGLLG
jgi:SAM-dependent MidA family methyltransferase